MMQLFALIGIELHIKTAGPAGPTRASLDRINDPYHWSKNETKLLVEFTIVAGTVPKWVGRFQFILILKGAYRSDIRSVSL